MRSNSLYRLIFDGVISLAQLNIPVPVAKETSNGIPYFLIPFLQASIRYSNRDLQRYDLSRSDCQFEYNQEKYILVENHISIYRDMIDKEEKVPVLSCYHYTATYQNYAGIKIHIHMYFSCQGTILTILSGNEKYTFLASKDKITVDNIPSSERLRIEKTANHFCTAFLSSIHVKWSSILGALKEKIASQQGEVNQLSKKIIPPVYVREDLAEYLQKLQVLIELYDQYIRYSPNNRTEIAICKLLKQSKVVFTERVNALDRKPGKKKKQKKSTCEPSAMSFSQISEALEYASVPSKSKREQRLERLNTAIAAAKENKDPTESVTQLHSLYQRKLELLSVASMDELYEIISDLTKNRVLLNAQLLTIAMYGDLESFNKMIGFLDEIEDRTLANFFFMLARRGHTNLFDYALKVVEQFNANTQFLMLGQSLLMQSCEHEDSEIAYLLVRSLVENSNVSLNSAVDMSGYTPLHAAVFKNNIRLVELLIAHGHAVDPIQSRPALISLGSGENQEIIKEFHGKVANEMSTLTITYRTPLFLACNSRYEEIIAILLPLHTNARQREYLGFDSLGAYLYNSRADRKKTPCNEETIKKLCEKGCVLDDYHGENKAGATALFFAVQEGDIEALKILLELGANPNLRNEKQGLSPILMACNKKEIDMVALLLDHPATEITEDEFIISVYTTVQQQAFEITLLLITKKIHYWRVINDLCGFSNKEFHIYLEDTEQTCVFMISEDPNLITIDQIMYVSEIFLDVLGERADKIFNRNIEQAQTRARDRTNYLTEVRTVYKESPGVKQALRFLRQRFTSQEAGSTSTHSSSSSYSV